MKTNTVIVGASAAGLSTAACLKRRGVDFVLLEQHQQVATAWRDHYERLHLHTPKSGSGLPYFPMPKSYEKYPTRAQVVEYMELYKEHHKLDPQFGQSVSSIRRLPDGTWRTQTQDQTLHSSHVVIATGYTRLPTIPKWEGFEEFGGEWVHSSSYKNGRLWKDKKVLVVGFGNSGCEIAIDLHEHGARPHMAVRSPVNIVPRDIFGIPILSFGILLSKLPGPLADALGAPLINLRIGDFTKYGLRRLPYGPITQIKKESRIPLLDIGTLRLIREGKIQIHQGIERFTSEGIEFTDGSTDSFDAMVLATGYHPGVQDFLEQSEIVTNKHNLPLSSGQNTALEGLYFCGFYVAPSGMLREISIEAKRIAKDIAQNLRPS